MQYPPPKECPFCKQPPTVHEGRAGEYRTRTIKCYFDGCGVQPQAFGMSQFEPQLYLNCNMGWDTRDGVKPAIYHEIMLRGVDDDDRFPD